MNRFAVLWHILCVAILIQSSYASLLAIDYGSDWIKASLVKPGVPFDVLLNKDSKRKIQSSVGWKRDDRLFSTDAFNIAGRFPKDTFSSLKYLQAVPFDSPLVPFYKSISTAELTRTARGTVGVRRPDGTEWSVEELIAMQFSYIKDLAESEAGEIVRDVIVTVPPYYTQFERDAVVDAIEVAGLRTLALINDGTAVAVNYAMTRTFPSMEHHIIYDAGASSVRATVASFVKTAAKDGTAITIAGVGFDRNVGGTELDRRLRDILVKDFERKHTKPIRDDSRGLAKMWKEANRVKAILSANAEAMASIESVAFDVDYRSKITRAEFESACQDLQSRFTQPIFDALHNSGLTLDDITSVILTGGSSRTPMIQAAVRAAVGDSKIALNVNADEAAVLGAALHGASLSRQFRTKDIAVHDIGPYDIQVSYPAELKFEGAKPRTIQTLVFPAGSKTGSKKTLTFKRKDDLTLTLSYKRPPYTGFPTDILEADITGIGEAIRNLTDLGAIDPVIKATLVLSESGFTSVQDAIALGTIKDDSFTGKLKGLFGGVSSPSAEATNESGESASNTETPTPVEPASVPSVTESVIPLDVTTRLLSLPPMTVEEKRRARDRLITIDAIETTKRRREEARNTLESYMYRVRDLLDEDTTDSPFIKCSQASERKAMDQKLQETFSWLHEHGDDAETSQYIEKRTALESLERPVVFRYKEIEEFPAALNNSQMWNWSTRLFLTDAKANLTAAADGGPPSRYTQDEIDGLEKTLKEHETWLNEQVENQKRVKMYEDPVLTTSQLKARARTLELHLQKLVRKKIPKVTKQSSSTSATGTSSGSSSTPSESPGRESHDEL